MLRTCTKQIAVLTSWKLSYIFFFGNENVTRQIIFQHISKAKKQIEREREYS